MDSHTFKDDFLLNSTFFSSTFVRYCAFVEKNSGLKCVRLSMSPYREQDWLTNYPLYSVEAVMKGDER